jgi:hypothetical protein
MTMSFRNFFNSGHLIWFSAIVLSALSVSYWLTADDLLFRYRLTVTFATPEGPKSGSGVLESRWTDNTKTSWFPYEARLMNVRNLGEAIFVDLGQGKNAIAILAYGPTAGEGGTPLAAVTAMAAQGMIPGMRAAINRGWGKELPTPRTATPTIITFANLTDPQSAKVIFATQRESPSPSGTVPPDPFWGKRSIAHDAIAKTFGPGYALTSVDVELVPSGIWPFNILGWPLPQMLAGVPISHGIEARLPWLQAMIERERNSLTLIYPDRFTINSSYFSRRY